MFENYWDWAISIEAFERGNVQRLWRKPVHFKKSNLLFTLKHYYSKIILKGGEKMDKLIRLSKLCEDLGLKLNNMDYSKDIYSRQKNEFMIVDDSKYEGFKGFIGAKGFISYTCFANNSKPAPISPSNPHSIYNMNRYLSNSGISCTVIEDSYLNSKTKIKCRCKCGNIFYSRWNTIRCTGKTSCDECGIKEGAYNKVKTSISKNGSMRDLLFEEYGDKWRLYWNFDKNYKPPEKISSTSNETVYLNCGKIDYHTYFTSPISFRSGVRCGYCTGKRLHIKDTIGEKNPSVVKLWSERNKLSPFEIFYNSPLKVWIECPNGKHEDSYKEVRDITRRNSGCLKCSYISNRGKNNYNWKGGVSDLRAFLRDKISGWKKDTMIKYRYRCDVTGDDRDFEIHHIKSFSDIFYEFISLESIEVKSIGEYSEEYKMDIENRFVKYHNSFGLGVLMSKKVHKDFHRKYGNSPTTKDYEEFKSEYVNNK